MLCGMGSKAIGEPWFGILCCPHISYSLNSLKGGYIGDNIGDYYRGY